jgi:hypothetical protein
MFVSTHGPEKTPATCTVGFVKTKRKGKPTLT